MAILFVTILIFGYSKLFLVTEVISENERLDIINKITIALEYCEDPLNKGSKRIINFKHKDINSFCLLNSNLEDIENSNLILDLETIYETGDNVVLLNLNQEKYNILASFKVDKDFKNSYCSDIKNFEIIC